MVLKQPVVQSSSVLQRKRLLLHTDCEIRGRSVACIGKRHFLKPTIAITFAA